MGDHPMLIYRFEETEFTSVLANMLAKCVNEAHTYLAYHRLRGSQSSRVEGWKLL